MRQTQVNEATKARISKTLQVWSGPMRMGGKWDMEVSKLESQPLSLTADLTETECGVWWEVNNS